MASRVQSLWPEAIRSNIPSPDAILQSQAAALRMQTGGLLLGDISRREADDDRIALSLDIVVPALDGARYRILTVGYGKDMFYPAVLDAEVFRNPQRKGRPSKVFPEIPRFRVPESFKERIEAAQAESKAAARLGELAGSDEELIELISQVLKSPPVVSLAQSLIARVNDISPTDEGPSGVDDPPGPGSIDASEEAAEEG